jgi:hypothetical protein
MVSYLVPDWIIWAVLGFFLLMSILVLFFLFKWLKVTRWSDIHVVVKGDNRASVEYTNFRGEMLKDERNKQVYHTPYEAALNFGKGKQLFIHTWNQPQPLKISANRTTWLNSDTLMSVMNNEIIKFILRIQEKLEMIAYITMIAACISAAAGIMIALKVFNVFKGG